MKLNFNDIFIDDTKNVARVPSNEYEEQGTIAIVDQGKEDVIGYTNDTTLKICNEERIIFGDHTRNIKYINIPFITGADGTKVLKIKDNNKYDYKYMYYYLKASYIPNTGYNRHFKWVKELKFNIPNIEEQKMIVTKLDRLQDMINLKYEERDLLRKLIKSQFIEMFGNPYFNEKKWDLGRIRDVVDEVKYGTSKPSNEGGKYKYLRMNNITYNGELDLTELKYIDIPENEIEKYSTRKGDILFNRTNSRDKVGKTCVFNNDEKMIIAGFIIRVRVNNLVNPYFLSEFLNTKYIKEVFYNSCKNASGQSNINAQELQDLTIYIPPIELQNKFALLVENNNKAKEIIQNDLIELVELQENLMNKYFN